MGWLTVALGVGLAACSGKLLVYDADKVPIVGMPFRTAEVYVKEGTHTKSTKGVKCDPAQFQDILALPTGAQYYATATSSSFAKTSFHIKYNDAGGVSEVGLDSEPAGADNIRAVSDLIKTLAPLAGASALGGARPTGVEPAIACDAGEENVTYRRLEEYVKFQKARPSP